MSKVVSVLEIVVGVVVGVVAGWTGVGAYFAAMLISAGITGLAASYLAPGTPKIGRSDQNAPVQRISVDPDAYGTLVYGEAKCGGVMIYQNVCSSDGSQTYDILDYVVAHCFTDLTRGVEHMGAIYINDQLIPESSIDGSGNVTSGDFAGMVQVWRYDGTQTAADTVLVSAYGSDPDLPWPSTAIGKGICYTHYRFKSGTDQDKFNRAFSGGPPNNVATVIKGEKPYDPRTSAYAYSENPAICLRDFMTRTDNGAGVPTTYLDATILAASANICDEVITYPDGTTTGPRFKCDGAIGLGDSRKSIIGDILASMAGEVIQSNGLLSVRSGSYTPPSGTITEDFLSGSATSSEPTQDMRYNHVLANYIGPKSNWQNVQAPAYPALSSSTYAAWLAQDGTRIDKQLGLKMVTNPENAQVIEQIVGNQSRYLRGVSLQCNAKALAFTTGDRVTLNIPECGETNEIFKITGMRLRPDFGADVQLVADDPSIYGWDNVIAVDVPGMPLPGTKYSAPPAVTGFTCRQQPGGVGISWDTPDINKVDATEVRRGTSIGGQFNVIYRGFGNSFTDHLQGDGSTYYYYALNYLRGVYGVPTSVLTQSGVLVATQAEFSALQSKLNANLPPIQNPTFATGDLTGWTPDNAAEWSIGPGPSPFDLISTYVQHQYVNDGTTALRNSGVEPVQAGDVITITAQIFGSGTPNGSAWARIEWLDNTGATITTKDGSKVAGNGLATSRANQVAPANAVACRAALAVDSHTTGTYAFTGVAINGMARSLDEVPDGSIKIAGVQISDNVVVDNAAFEASSDLPPPGWGTVNGATLSYATGGAQYAGTQSLVYVSGGSGSRVVSSRIYKCRPGDVFILSARCAGNTYVTSYMFLRFYSAASGFLSEVSAFAVPKQTGYTAYAGQIQVPASADYFRISAGCDTINLGMQIDDIALGHVVTQGSILPTTWAGVRSVLSKSPISFSISGTTVNFTTTAFTNYGGGLNVAYNAASASVTQTAGTTVTYYAYFIDPTSSGGSQTLHITSTVQDLAQSPYIVYIGNATVTVNSGGGGSGGTGGGGGGFCVADDMWIRAGLKAGDAQIGDLFDCIDLPTSAGKHQRALQGVSRGTEECVRLITDDGCALTCSETTPFDTLDGRTIYALEMLGEQVITDLGIANVISLALVGRLPVTRAHLGGVSYAAGSDPTHRIYSHNVNGPVKP